MKKIVLVLVGILLTLSSYSQTTVEFLVDPTPTIVSEEQGFDFMLRIETDQPFFNLIENMRVGFDLEHYSKRKFTQFNVSYGYVVNYKKLQAVGGIQGGFIVRTDVPLRRAADDIATTNISTYSVGLNGTLRYFILNDLGVVARITWVTRNDISAWGDNLDTSRHNGYIGLVYKF